MQTTSDLSSHELTDPALLRSFYGHKDQITQVIFNPNLRQLISSSIDGIIMTWGLKPNSRPQKFLGHQGAVYDVSVNPSGTMLASCSKDNTIRIWNNNTEGSSQVLKGHSASVKSVQFSCDGCLLLSASDDKTIKIWQVAERKFSQTLKGHTHWVRKANFSFDSRMIVSGSDDKTVRLWDVNQNGQLIHTITDHTGMISDVKFHPDGTCLASCSSDKKIKIFDVRSKRLLQHYDAHSDLINSIAFHPQGSYLISTSNDGTIKIWDLRKGHILYTLYGHEGHTTGASFSPSGDYFCTGGKDATVMLWKSNLNPVQIENLQASTSKITTEVYVTDQKEVKNVPKQQENKSKLANQKKNKSASPTKEVVKRAVSKDKTEEVKPLKQHQVGDAYKQLKPEVKMTLDKIVQSVELVSKTLQVLEQRVIYSEDKMREVQEYIKMKDFNFRPQLSQSVIQNQALINQSITGLAPQIQQMRIEEDRPVQIAEGLKQTLGGEEFFRQTNGPAIPEFSIEQMGIVFLLFILSLAKIDNFLVKSYGVKVAQQIKLDCTKKKDLMRTILVKELNSTYKYADAAFAALDFNGRGFVDLQDIIESKIMFKLPFTKDVNRKSIIQRKFIQEVKTFLESDTILKKVPKLKIEMFTKLFYPTKTIESKGNFDFSDSDQETQVGGGLSKKSVDLNTVDNSSLMSVNRNKEITQQIKQIEQVIKERLSNNWVSVRKAFLDLDEDYDGFLTPEDFAKLIGGSSGRKDARINYTEFSQWVGQVIEPAEAFYFRHDSQKNPQYEKNMQKTVIQYSGSQRKIREMISKKNLKGMFIDKVRLQFKSTKKAFSQLSKAKDGFISFEQLLQVIKNWGFEASEDHIKDLFEWLDSDKDGRVSYEDLRSTVGLDINPMEQLFFRQDVKPGKTINCKFEKCWENNNSNSKSAYCQLHQKVLRNLCLDRFAQIAQQINDEKWKALTSCIINANYQMTIKEFESALTTHAGKNLKYQEKEWIWETFKVKQYIEDNPDNINDRLVSLQAFMNARKQTRLRKINELISLEKEEEQFQEDIKLKGLIQVDEQYIFKMAVTKKSQWGGIWKSIKNIDRDSNGYVTAGELEELFKEFFPVELDGKSLQKFFTKYQSISNKALIHYKRIKEELNERIILYDRQEALIRDKLSEFKNRSQLESSQIQATPPPKQIINGDDEEENLQIQGTAPAVITPRASGRASIQEGDNFIIKKRRSSAARSTTSMFKRGPDSSRLPQQNLMVRNTSIQRLNNLSITDQENDMSTLLYNNKDATPIMKKQNSHGMSRNMSALKKNASMLSVYSRQTLNKLPLKLVDELRNKLGYEWKNIYRAISQLDNNKRGLVNINQLNKVVHQFKVYLSKEELRKIEGNYGISQTALGMEIDYIKLSQELGLHKSSLDYIRIKSQKFIDQMNQVKDIDSKCSLTSRLNYIKQNSILDTSSNDIRKTSLPTIEQKIKRVREFLTNMDKTKSGKISAASFLKVSRIFGLNVNSQLLPINEVDMIDYEQQLQAISA